jgi:hypothetical protein
MKSNSKNDRDLVYRLRSTSRIASAARIASNCRARSWPSRWSQSRTPATPGKTRTWLFRLKLVRRPDGNKRDSIKGSQLLRRCLSQRSLSGCGETPYIKDGHALFGDRMIIERKGCRPIYGGSFPTSPIARRRKGRGRPGAIPCSRITPSTVSDAVAVDAKRSFWPHRSSRPWRPAKPRRWRPPCQNESRWITHRR